VDRRAGAGARLRQSARTQDPALAQLKPDRTKLHQIAVATAHCVETIATRYGRLFCGGTEPPQRPSVELRVARKGFQRN
jgi:hypothetical protein